jgi:hypothetical protein
VAESNKFLIKVKKKLKFIFANRAIFLYPCRLLCPKFVQASGLKGLFLTRIFFKEVMMKTIFTLLAMLVFSSAAIVVPQSSAFAASQYPNKGKVLETMDASIYTYIQVSTDKSPVWLAASKTKVTKGDTISYPNGSEMSNFTSKSLNRTFDKIIFIDKIKVEKAEKTEKK